MAKTKSQAEVLRYLIERAPFCRKEAVTAREEGREGLALHLETLAAEADVLYAWIVSDDSVGALAHIDKQRLIRDIELVDRHINEYRAAEAEPETETVAA